MTLSPFRNLPDLAERVLGAARTRNFSIVTAESCTAGKLATLLSEAEGASVHLHGGFVAYTKANKEKALGVPASVLRTRGAVCPEVAKAMAKGALSRTPADYAVAITGVAGPERDEDGNPVGMVCIAIAQRGSEPVAIEKRYKMAKRTEIQERAMADALSALLKSMVPEGGSTELR